MGSCMGIPHDCTVPWPDSSDSHRGVCVCLSCMCVYAKAYLWTTALTPCLDSFDSHHTPSVGALLHHGRVGRQDGPLLLRVRYALFGAAGAGCVLYGCLCVLAVIN